MKTTIEEMQTLISIVDLGSITLAAERLEQTTSGVSRTLSRLEKKLGVTLLRRTTRKIDLTPEGENFLTHARQILQSIEAAEASVSNKENAPTGILRVDSASPFVIHSITPFVQEFMKLYPGITLELYSNDRTIDLIEKRIDVAIRIGKLEDSTLTAVSLGTSRRRILASPAYLKQYGTPKNVDDLQNHHLIGFTDPRHLNQWPLKTTAGPYLAKCQIGASSGETILNLARENAGIVCLSDFMTMKDRKEGKLVQILANHTIDNRELIHAVYYKNIQVSNRVNLFIKFLKSKLKGVTH